MQEFLQRKLNEEKHLKRIDNNIVEYVIKNCSMIQIICCQILYSYIADANSVTSFANIKNAKNSHLGAIAQGSIESFIVKGN